MPSSSLRNARLLTTETSRAQVQLTTFKDEARKLMKASVRADISSRIARDGDRGHSDTISRSQHYEVDVVTRLIVELWNNGAFEEVEREKRERKNLAAAKRALRVSHVKHFLL